MIKGYSDFKKLKELGRNLSDKEELQEADVLFMQRVMPCIALDEIDAPSVLMDHGAMRKLSFGFKHYMDISDPVKKESMEEDIEKIREELAEIMEKPDVVLSNSEFIKWQMKKHFDIDTIVVNSPVNTDKFYPTDDDGDYFVSVQRMSWHKRVVEQIKAFKDTDEELRIIGGEEYKDEIERMAEPHDNIKFLGKVSDEELRKQYSGANAVVSTGIQEDFGLVPREGMACGTPFITGHEGGYIELAESGNYGITFNPAHPVESMKHAIHRFDEDDFDEEELVRKVEEQYSLDVIKPQLEDAVELAYRRYHDEV